MRNTLRCRGSSPPVLFILLAAAMFQFGSLDTPVYATPGPEAPPILRSLVADAQIVNIQPGGLAAVIAQRPVGALVLPEDWNVDTDLAASQSAKIPVIRLKRHTSIANITANFRALGALTRSEGIASRWISQIDTGIAQIRHNIARYKPTRVLVLSPEGYTQGQGALITELIGIANGVNVAAEAGIPEARQIDDAQIREFAPDVVLLIDWEPEAAIAFAYNRLYQGIAAFDRDHVYRITPPGKDPARLVEDVRALADLMHPAEF